MVGASLSFVVWLTSTPSQSSCAQINLRTIAEF